MNGFMGFGKGEGMRSGVSDILSEELMLLRLRLLGGGTFHDGLESYILTVEREASPSRERLQVIGDERV